MSEDLRTPLLSNNNAACDNDPLLDWPFEPIIDTENLMPTSFDDLVNDDLVNDSVLINYNPTMDNNDEDLTDNNYEQELPFEYPVPSDLSIDATNFCFDIKCVQFPKKIYKKQRRMTIDKKQTSQQRLKEDEAQFKVMLMFNRPNALRDIKDIKVKVLRQNPVPIQMKLFTGEALLSNCNWYQEQPNSTGVTLKGNLDVYKVGDEEVYKLAKTGMSEHNMFVVKIEVIFRNGVTTRNTTEPFLVVGRNDKFDLPGILNPNYTAVKKRRLESSVSSNPCSVESRGSINGSPINSYYESDSSGTNSFVQRFDERYAKVQKKVFDYLKARVGEFDELRGSLLTTKNGDIAYHFIVNPNVHADFSTGEVIGFFSDKLGKTVIEKLTGENASRAYMKGVVTNSQYIEANKPADENVKTATVCMLGLVDVNAMGSIEPGESLYASQRCPGIAVSEYHSTHSFSDKDAYIGQALERKKCTRESERHSIKALVSLVGGAMNKVMRKELSEIEESMHVNLKVGGRRSRRCICIASVLVVILLALFLVLFWQLYLPGSEYKRYKCRKGSIAGSVNHAKYWTWAEEMGHKGIEFTCNALWEKVKDRFYLSEDERNIHAYRCPDNYHYYLNVERCSGIGNNPLMFAIDRNCTHVYTFRENTGRWTVEKLVCWDPKCNIQCSFTDGRDDSNCSKLNYSKNCTLILPRRLKY
ncbi:uncharacterized protein LOC130645231 [Hydractinia symbiolongicarpus]|uniref:uncharacterized protein LOC130645231 n=1 Tax=Hydractinia symbiolongicarpus TaxID=13093 RepID=UPI00254A0233|nr:uncharacterized protein LOC130645231 [Hydractinia symbiolongicarpus]XP_057307145.1 uncharacterized protein LOC130645231 [Hydractinia symbiolongicarpus]XP_057307154.1 uncharacterized protein LOC130645231 [Hydractinia symbiolongicarpus]